MAKFIFTWENLGYSVSEKEESTWKPNRKKRIIIDGVSGSAFSGSLMAVMGISGSGKTTLLTLLSGERRGQGVLKINGRIINGKMLSSNCAFMQQKEYFFETLSVYEHMSFMAAMSLKKASPDRKLMINKLLMNLNLINAKYTKIQFLSGGEKRKLSLAAKLLLDPYILFCDEPTSGLDSFSAISIVKILETVAESGKIVFLTVHQPSSLLFDLFDNIILLSTKGKFIFQGSKDNMRSFFESQGLICPSSYNPADFYLKNSVITSVADVERVKCLTENFNRNYKVDLQFSDDGYNGLLLKYRKYDKSFFHMLGWLSWRIFITLKGSSRQYLASFLILMITASIIGVTYINSFSTGNSGVQNVQGALLLICSELIFHHLQQIIHIFPSEVDIFVQEKNLYDALPYFLSKLFSLIPFGIVNSFGFLAVYFLCLPFLGGFGLFLEMYLILLMTSLGGSALGLCLSALFPTVELVHTFVVPLELLVLLLSGLWIKIDTLPKIFSSIKYCSPFYYSFESMSIVYWMKIDRIDNCTGVIDMPCYQNGLDVLESFDFGHSYSKVINNLFFMFGLITVYCYVGYIGILRKRALYEI